MSLVFDPSATSPPPTAQPVYAFNTDSMSGARDGRTSCSARARASRAARRVRLRRRALRHGRRARRRHLDPACDTIAAAAAVADAGLRARALPGSALRPDAAEDRRLHRRTTAPTNPAFHGTGDGQCTTTAYCEVMFDLTVREGIPTSQIGQITSTDLAAGVLVSQGYTAFINPSSTIAAGAGDGAAAFVNAGGPTSAPRAVVTTSARNAGITTVNTNTDQRDRDTWLDVRRRRGDREPGRLGLRRRRLDLPRGEQRPDLRPGDAGRQRGTIPAATAVSTYGPSGDCGGPAGCGELLRVRRQRQRDAARSAGSDRPAVRRRTRDPSRVRRVVSRLDDAGGAARSERGALPVGPRDPGDVLSGARCPRLRGGGTASAESSGRPCRAVRPTPAARARHGSR